MTSLFQILILGTMGIAFFFPGFEEPLYFIFILPLGLVSLGLLSLLELFILRQSNHRHWNLKEYKNHENYDVPTLLALLSDSTTRGLALKVFVKGFPWAPSSLLAPLSKRVGLGWSLHVEYGVSGSPVFKDKWNSLMHWGELASDFEVRPLQDSQSQGLLIQPPAFFQLGHDQIQVFSLSEFKKSYPAFYSLVQKSMDDKGLSSSKYPMLRVTEGLLTSNDSMETYGLTDHNSNRALLRGDGVAESPESLMIRSVTPADQKKQTRFLSPARSKILLANLVLILLGIGLFGHQALQTRGMRFYQKNPWLNWNHLAPVQVVVGNELIRVTQDKQVWNLMEAQLSNRLDLTFEQKPAHWQAQTPITILRLISTAKIAHPHTHYHWNGTQWNLDPEKAWNQGPSVLPAFGGTGPLYIKNPSNQDIKIQLSEYPETYWTIPKGRGLSLERGTTLTRTAQDVTQRVALSPGMDVTLLNTEKNVLRQFTLGLSTEIPWTQGDGWELMADDALVTPYQGPLNVLTASNLEYHIQFLENKILKYDGVRWMIIPPPEGLSPPYTLKNSGSPIVINETGALLISKIETEVLYQGPLNLYQGAVYNENADTWVLDLSQPSESSPRASSEATLP